MSSAPDRDGQGIATLTDVISEFFTTPTASESGSRGRNQYPQFSEDLREALGPERVSTTALGNRVLTCICSDRVEPGTAAT